MRWFSGKFWAVSTLFFYARLFAMDRNHASHHAEIIFTHVRGALVVCPLIQHWTVCVICLCFCMYVPSCMSILTCHYSVLSGSRAAWSTEIAVTGRRLVVREGGAEDGSLLQDPSQSTAEKSITFPLSAPTSAKPDHVQLHCRPPLSCPYHPEVRLH